jgi:hypothetical protein
MDELRERNLGIPRPADARSVLRELGAAYEAAVNDNDEAQPG